MDLADASSRLQIAAADILRLHNGTVNLPGQPTAAIRRRETLTTAAGTVAVAIYLLLFRTHELGSGFPLLGEQIRDWGTAQHQFGDLPRVGVQSVISGVDIGPIFYWTLWFLRVCIEPVAGPLPHAGGLAVALFQTLCDGVLLLSLARFLSSWSLAACAVVFVATASPDASLSGVVWNPPVATAFAKLTFACTVWSRKTTFSQGLLVSAFAFAAVQCHFPALFAAAPCVAAVLFCVWRQQGIRAVLALAAIGTTACLWWAAPYLQDGSGRTTPDVMRSLVSVGSDPLGSLRPLESMEAIGRSFAFVYLDPFGGEWLKWLLLVGLGVALLRWRDPQWLGVTVAPLLLAALAFSIWQGPLGEAYWLLHISPAATLCLASPLLLLRGPARTAGVCALVTIILAVQPARANQAWTAYRQPAYGPLARGVQTAATGPSVRDVRPDFAVPVGMDPLFMFSLAGGKLDHLSKQVLVIEADGTTRYERTDGQRR